MEISKREQKEADEERRKREAEAKDNPLLKLMGMAEQEKPVKDDKLADGFVRSKRNQALRMKGEILNQIQTIQDEKVALIQKLNNALVALDKMNSTKKEIGNKLLEQVKFVRDL